MSKSGCFSGIVRMLLCQGSLHNQPSDGIKEPKTWRLFHDLNKAESEKPKPQPQPLAVAAAAPGVVARLMGLESIPPESGRRPDCVIRRSRSVNFVDYLLEFDLTKHQHQQQHDVVEEEGAHHRRIRTSVSFREVPQVLNQEGPQNLFVLYLRDDNKTPTQPKTNNNNVEHKNPKKTVLFRQQAVGGNMVGENNEPKQVSKLQGSLCHNNRRRRKGSPSCTRVAEGVQGRGTGRTSTQTPTFKTKPKPPINDKEVFVESQFMKSIKKKKKKTTPTKRMSSPIGEAESVFSSAEGSSPVSVLDLKEPPPIAFLSTEHVKLNRLMTSKKRCSHTMGKSPELDPPREIITRDQLEEDRYDEFVMQLTRKLLVLAEEDVTNCNWVAKSPSFELECFEDICFEFGQEILDCLLFQLVQDLHVG